MTRLARLTLSVLCLLVPSALAGCSDVGGTGDLQYVSGDGQVIEVPAKQREDPVDVSGKTVQGDDLDLAGLRGKVVVVNVWWSGCGPCIKEMPMLVDAEHELARAKPGQVAFVGVNIRDLAPENAAAFERARGVDYPSLYDPGSETLLDGMGRYAPSSPPSTLVLDRSGRVAALINGPIPSKSTLTTLVEDTLAESGGPAGGSDG